MSGLPVRRRAAATALSLSCALAALAGLGGRAAFADDSLFTSSAGVKGGDGVQIFTHICQGCHMPEGQGAVGAGFYPKLAGDPALVSWEYAALTVLNGKHGMPPFGLPADEVMETRTVHLSDAQIAAVVNYVRTNFGNRYKGRVTAAEVAALPHPSSVRTSMATKMQQPARSASDARCVPDHQKPPDGCG